MPTRQKQRPSPLFSRAVGRKRRTLMKKRIFILIGLLVLMYACLRVGYHIGTTKGFYTFFNENIDGSSIEIGLQVKTLEMLKKGEVEKAEEFLEKLMDNELGFLGVSAENKHLKDKEKLLEAIRTAKTYRETYPGHKVQSTMNSGVVKAFGLVAK